MLYVRGFLSSLYLCVSAKSHKLGNGLQALEPKKEITSSQSSKSKEQEE